VGGITVAALSHHLRVLREAGLTRTRVSGKHRFLSLRLAELEQRFPGMITSVLRAGPEPAGQTGPGGQPR
jgi:DNA-binding transcriptional ArsR family regulator